MTKTLQALPHHSVTLTTDGLRVGGDALNDDEVVYIPGSGGSIPGAHLRQAANHWHGLLPDGHPPQLSLLQFNLTGDSRALEHYFTIVRGMPGRQKNAFHQTLAQLAETPTLHVALIGAGKRDRSRAMPAGIRHLVAGLILEVLYFRPDLVKAFFQRRKRFRLYTSVQALRDDGGIGGGCYQPNRRVLQMVLSRLWEGYDQPAPGVSPFLHEFGHMLDAFDGVSGRLGALNGLLPGMDAEATRAFIAGRALELERYHACQRQPQSDRGQQPLGHPYVFQNEREFLAGYFEMFFRNPHTFAVRNPQLFQAFSLTLRQDPRAWLPADYTGYLAGNFTAYLTGNDVPPAGIQKV